MNLKDGEDCPVVNEKDLSIKKDALNLGRSSPQIMERQNYGEENGEGEEEEEEAVAEEAESSSSKRKVVRAKSCSRQTFVRRISGKNNTEISTPGTHCTADSHDSCRSSCSV